MGNFQRGNKSGYGARSFGYDRNRDSGRHSSRAGLDRPQMFRATCANCGNDCEVPFRPTGSKPIFCNNCFDKSSSQEGGRRSFSGREARVRTSFADRPMYDAICTNCGSACRIPFEPKEGREILCSNCFEAKTGSAPRQSSRMNGGPRGRERGNGNNPQIEALNAKLDLIMAHLGITTEQPKVILKELKKDLPKEEKIEAEPVPLDNEPLSHIIDEVIAEGIGETPISEEKEEIRAKKKNDPKEKAIQKERITHSSDQVSVIYLLDFIVSMYCMNYFIF